MLDLTTNGSEGLKTMVDMVQTLNDEAIVKISPDGLDFKVMDIDRSGLIDFFWKKENMIDFKCDEEQDLGFDCRQLKNILARAKSSDNLHIVMNKGCLNIDMGKKSYEMRLISCDMVQVGKTPKINHELMVDIPLSELKDRMDDVNVVSENVTIKMKNGYIEFSGSGDHKATSIYENESIKTDSTFESKYQMSRLLEIIKTIKKIDTVRLGIGNDFPLKMEFILKDTGKINYYLGHLAINT